MSLILKILNVSWQIGQLGSTMLSFYKKCNDRSKNFFSLSLDNWVVHQVEAGGGNTNLKVLNVLLCFHASDTVN